MTSRAGLHRKTNDVTKLPILNKIFNDIERSKEIDCSLLKNFNTNTTCSMYTLGQREREIMSVSKSLNYQRIKNFTNRPTLTIDKAIAENNEWIRKQESLLLDSYAKLQNDTQRVMQHESISGDYLIANDYTKLQRKNKLIRKQENALLHAYAKQADRIAQSQRISTDSIINCEYGTLRRANSAREYCTTGTLSKDLNKQSNKSFDIIKQSDMTKEQNEFSNISVNCQTDPLAKQKSFCNYQSNTDQTKQDYEDFLEDHSHETLLKVDNLNVTLEDPKNQENCILESDNTLLTEQQPEPNNSMLKEQPSAGNNCSDKNLLDTKSIVKFRSKEIICPELKQLFYNNRAPHDPDMLNGNVEAEIKTNQTKTQNNTNPKIKLQQKIRQVIVLGKSADVLKNKLLANAIETAMQNKFSWSTIKSLIKNVGHSNAKQQILQLLQIQLQQRVFILCTVRTCDFDNLFSALDKIMMPLKAQFAPVLQHFSHCCIIEAIVPNDYLELEPKKLRRHLDWDAEALKVVNKIDLIDVSRGEVSVECLPGVMFDFAKSLEMKGYKVLTTEYGFRPNKEIFLDTKTGAEYRRFINKLLEISDIETISDNVIS